jgi:hypothetical protein
VRPLVIMKTSFTNDLVNRGVIMTRATVWQTTKKAEEISRKWQSNRYGEPEPELLRSRLSLHKVFFRDIVNITLI